MSHNYSSVYVLSEHPSEFVKNLDHVESIGSLLKRKLEESVDSILINENTVFNTEGESYTCMCHNHES